MMQPINTNLNSASFPISILDAGNVYHIIWSKEMCF